MDVVCEGVTTESPPTLGGLSVLRFVSPAAKFCLVSAYPSRVLFRFLFQLSVGFLGNVSPFAS